MKRTRHRTRATHTDGPLALTVARLDRDIMRRRPAAVAAAILTGREMNLPPMVALRMLYVVHGRVGQTAELMRALILARGHELRDIEVTNSRVILEGRRTGETEWARATFTEADARKAGIRLGEYPADKLYARATSRLARRKFADVIAGLPTVDELEDAASQLGETPDTGTGGPPIQRKRPTKPAKAARTQPKPTTPAAAEPDEDIAELLGDQTETTSVGQAADKSGPDSAANDVPPPTGAPDEPGLPATKPQIRKFMALCNQLDLTNPDDRHTITDHILNYHVAHASDLTKTEANRLIDTLENWTTDTEYPAQDRINDILNTAALRAEAEQDNDDGL